VLLPASSELKNLVVVLVRTRNPLNIGAAARAMSNFGVHHLRLVNPYSVAFREAHSAVGAADVLKHAEEYKTLAEAVADCLLVVGTTAGRKRTLQHPLRRLDEVATELRQNLQNGRVALLFGNEKIGLTNDDFSHCHWLLTIPTQKDHISMNLGQAVAACLYELARNCNDKRQSCVPAPERASAAVNEQISQILLEALAQSGYIQPGSEAACENKVRRMVLRFGLNPEDAKVFLGMVRQIVWRLRQGKPVQ
jgi:TrmH family RNA methyltransferase